MFLNQECTIPIWKERYEEVCAYSFPDAVRSFQRTTTTISEKPFFEGWWGNRKETFMIYASEHSKCHLTYHRMGYQSNVTGGWTFKTVEDLMKQVVMKLKAESLKELVKG